MLPNEDPQLIKYDSGCLPDGFAAYRTRSALQASSASSRSTGAPARPSVCRARLISCAVGGPSWAASASRASGKPQPCRCMYSLMGSLLTILVGLVVDSVAPLSDAPGQSAMRSITIMTFSAGACGVGGVLNSALAVALNADRTRQLHKFTKTIALAVFRRYGYVMLLNHRALIREWCAEMDLPEQDGLWRHRYAREAKLLTEGPHGERALPATSQDGAVLLLSFIAPHSVRDVPRAVRKYGSLVLMDVDCLDLIEQKPVSPDTLQPPYRLHFSPGKTLLSTLAEMLEICGSQRMFRLERLKVDRSEKFPTGTLAIGVYENTNAEEAPRWIYDLAFRNPHQEKKADVIEVSYRLMGPALNTMADLLAPNVAATNRARMQAEHETGPSARTDEPLPPDDDDQNLPRATTPTATDTHPEASDKEKKSQVSFKSYSRSSGGSFLPPTEFCDDLDDRTDRPSPCAA